MSKIGQVFAVLFTEAAGMNSAINAVTDYNTALSRVRYNELAYTQVRRFIIVRRRRGFCYAVWGFPHFLELIDHLTNPDPFSATPIRAPKNVELFRTSMPLPIPLVSSRDCLKESKGSRKSPSVS